MIVCGIDPGKSGAVVVVEDNKVVMKTKTPVVNVGRGTKKDYDPSEMMKLLRLYDYDLVVIEKQQSFPGQGVASTFQTGMGYGLWLGLIVSAQVPYEEVRPTKWIKEMVGGSSGKGKGAHCLAAKRLLPGIDLKATARSKKDHDGIADAALLALYGHRILTRK